MEQQSFSLYEINKALKEVIKDIFFETVWVHAEISEIHTNANGHCYLELIEKDANNTIIARQKATIWSNNYLMIKPYFEQTTRMELQAGLEILIGCSIEMHENYGLSLNVININPEYTIGKISVEKTKILDMLHQDGVVELNKELFLSEIPQRVAVISSKTAAGYEDFCHHIKHNIYGYKYHIELFEARMQGDETEKSVIEALDRIFEKVENFDIVIIIRGGGATSDLSAFNNYNIAYRVAQFPLPVVCGIGHQRDETVVDIVSFKSVKTPTAAAEFLIEKYREQEDILNRITSDIILYANRYIEQNKFKIQNIAYKITILPGEFIIKESQNLDKQYLYLENKVKNSINMSNQKIDFWLDSIKTKSKKLIDNNLQNILLKEKTIQLLSPQTILKRGYTIVKQQDKFIKSVDKLARNEPFEIIFGDGVFKVESQNDKKNIINKTAH